jgi:very-short-patch-repair endonuclease
MTPFLGTEALSAGAVTRRSLEQHRRLHRNVFLPPGSPVTAGVRAKAAWLWSDRKAVVGGLSASALFGTRWIDADAPAELFRVNGKPVPGIVIHRDELHASEICDVSGIAATTPARTAFDLGRRKGLLRAVIQVDALAHQTGVTAQEIAALIPHHRGVRGLVQLRDVVELMDGGAESPQETKTRLVLIEAGLPKPHTQIRVHPYRLDMGYDEFKVAVEYDGEQHWKDPAQHARDIDRLADLAALGWRIIRVSAEILRYRPQVVIVRTCEALRAAGADWPLITQILRSPVQ